MLVSGKLRFSFDITDFNYSIRFFEQWFFINYLFRLHWLYIAVHGLSLVAL